MFDDLLNRRYEDFCSESGDDGCFGLAMEVCRRLGKPLPDYRLLALGVANQDKIEQFRTGFEKISSPEPGDLVLIRRLDGDGLHIGVVVENGQFMEAVENACVRKVRMNNMLVKDRIEGVYRYAGF